MSRMLDISGAIDRVLRAIGNASGIFFILLMGTIVLDVTTRGQGWTNSTKLQELEWHFHTALSFIVFSYTMALDKHVRVEVFRERWSAKTKAIVDILGLLLLFFLFVWSPSTTAISLLLTPFLEESHLLRPQDCPTDGS